MSFAWVLVPISYVLGTFPTALLVGSLVGHDPTVEGSRNPGASNMIRVAGRTAGMAVLVGDIAKAVVPTVIGYLAGGRALAIACGAAAVVGHVFPLQRRLRGGKGVATFGGMSLLVWPIVGLLGLAVWLVAFRFTHRASIGSMVGSLVVVAGTAVAGRPVWEVAVAAGLTVLVLVRHWSNLLRLLRRQESPI